MAKGGQKQTTTQRSGLTGPSAGMQNDIYGAARNAANNFTTVGPNAATTDALSMYRNIAAQGGNGLAALGGDANAMAALMNPYLHQVIDQANNQFGRTTQMVQNNVNDAATRTGAFGGSRHGVASGVALGEAANAHQANVANLLREGFSNAQGVAGQLANLGLGATGQIAGIGDYLRNIEQDQANPGVHRLGILNAGMAGGGQQSSQTSQTTQLPGTSALQNIAGIATMGAGLFGGGGLLAGLGGLGGLFGGNKTPSAFTTPLPSPSITPSFGGNMGFGGYQMPVIRNA
jgi:hypothetical protein